MESNKSKVSRIASIAGKVLWARNLPDVDIDCKSNPYCIIKAVLPSGNLVTLFKTQIIYNTLAPVWNEIFFANIPRNVNRISAIRFVLANFENCPNGDDVLGYLDVDVSSFADGKNKIVEGDLVSSGSKKSRSKKRTRLCIDFLVSRRTQRDSALLPADLSCPIRRVISHVRLGVMGAYGLISADGCMGCSDPYCTVTVGFYDGSERFLARTKVIQNTLTPNWEEEFEYTVEDPENPPIYLVFTLYDDDSEDGGKQETDDLLGEVYFMLSRISRFDYDMKFEFELDRTVEVAEPAAEPTLAGFVREKVKYAKNKFVHKSVQHGGVMLYRQSIALAYKTRENMRLALRLGVLAATITSNIMGSMLPTSPFTPSPDIVEELSDDDDEDMAQVSRKTKKVRSSCLSRGGTFTSLASGAPSGTFVDSDSSAASESFDVAHSYGTDVLSRFAPLSESNQDVDPPNKYQSAIKISIEINGYFEKVPHFELLDERNEIMWRAKENIIREVKPYVSIICGEVVNANQLIDSDLWGKSDPYCKVVVYFTDGSSTVVHQTKTISNSLNPIWRERFYFCTPAGESTPKPTKVHFNVYDSDIGIMEDDFLGFAKVWVKEVDVLRGIQQEMPLGGVQRKRKVDLETGRKSMSGKNEGTITISLGVEWRLQPSTPVVLSVLPEKWKHRRRSRNAREGDVLLDASGNAINYTDPSLMKVVRQDSSEVAPLVWDRYSTGNLAKKWSRSTKWEEIPDRPSYSQRPGIVCAVGWEKVHMPSRLPPPSDGLLDKIDVPTELVSKPFPRDIHLTDNARVTYARRTNMVQF